MKIDRTYRRNLFLTFRLSYRNIVYSIRVRSDDTRANRRDTIHVCDDANGNNNLTIRVNRHLLFSHEYRGCCRSLLSVILTVSNLLIAVLHCNPMIPTNLLKNCPSLSALAVSSVFCKFNATNQHPKDHNNKGL